MNSKNISNQNASATSYCLSADELVAYVDYRLSEQQLAEINQHLSQCELCSEAIEGAQHIPDGNGLVKIFSSLQQEILNRTAQPQRRRMGWNVYYAMAASLLLAISVIVYSFVHKPMNEKIYSRYFKPYPNTIPIVRGQEPVDRFKQAMIEYEFENYEAAGSILGNLLKNDPDNRTALFYAGISNLCLDKPDSAIILLKKMLTSRNGENEFKSRAKWYLGLAYLNKGDVKSARRVFNEIISEKSSYHQQSLEILDLLKSRL